MLKRVRAILFSPRARAMALTLSVACLTAASAFAEDPVSGGGASMASISTAFQAAMTTMVSDTFTMVAALVPIVVPLLGASIAVAYAIKYVKRLIK